MQFSKPPPLPALPGVEFREVPDWPGYAVSDDGRVWSCKGTRKWLFRQWRELKPSPRSLKIPYLAVVLCDAPRCETFGVHRLVMFAFRGPSPPDKEVAHFPDRDVTNNRLTNLSYVTKAENRVHRDLHGGTCRGERIARAKLTAAQIPEIIRLGGDGLSERKIAARYGVTKATIHRILKGRGWRSVPAVASIGE